MAWTSSCMQSRTVCRTTTGYEVYILVFYLNATATVTRLPLSALSMAKYVRPAHIKGSVRRAKTTANLGVRAAVRRVVVRRAAPRIVALLGRKHVPRKYVAESLSYLDLIITAKLKNWRKNHLLGIHEPLLSRLENEIECNTLSCEHGRKVKLISAEHRRRGSHLDGCMRARARVAARSLGTARPARGCPFSPRWRRRRVRTRAASSERAGARGGMAGRRRASAQRGAASTCSDRCTHARVWSVGRASRWTRRPAARRRPSAPALSPASMHDGARRTASQK
eukprot:6214839-Pleurochrysis_carterae.AAC.2